MSNQTITLKSPASPERLVKRSARVAFSALRALANQSVKVPGLLAQASQDIKDAWRETSRPNV